MNMKFAAATALASSLLVLPLMQGSAQSASLPSLPNHLEQAAVVAVALSGPVGANLGRRYVQKLDATDKRGSAARL
jgi:uncharacterized membrane protein YfcA